MEMTVASDTVTKASDNSSSHASDTDHYDEIRNQGSSQWMENMINVRRIKDNIQEDVRSGRTQMQSVIFSDMREEIERLSRRLVLANLRHESVMQLASKASSLQIELQAITERNNELSKDNIVLLRQIEQIQLFLEMLPTNRLVYMTRNPDSPLTLDIQAYTQLTQEDFCDLKKCHYQDLSPKQQIQFKLYQVLLVFAGEIHHVRSSNADQMSRGIPKDHRAAPERSNFAYDKVGTNEGKHEVEDYAMDQSHGPREEGPVNSLTEHDPRIAHLKMELASVRRERKDALEHIELLKSKLKKQETELEKLRKRLKNVLLSGKTTKDRRSRTERDNYTITQRLAQANMRVLCTEASKKEALIQVENLREQLTASREERCAIETKARLQLNDLELRLREVQTKLQAYEIVESQLDRAIEHRVHQRIGSPNNLSGNANILDEVDQVIFIPKYAAEGFTALPTSAARRIEHSMKLASQLRQREFELESLKRELTKMDQDVKEARSEVNRLSTVLGFSGKPVDVLARALFDRETQLEVLQTELSKTEAQSRNQNVQLEKLVKERNDLVKDLRRLLDSRQSLANTRKEIDFLIQNAKNGIPHSLNRDPKNLHSDNVIIDNNPTNRTLIPIHDTD